MCKISIQIFFISFYWIQFDVANFKPMDFNCFQVRSVEVKEALRLQKENNFVILDVRPEAEYKEVFFCASISTYACFSQDVQ